MFLLQDAEQFALQVQGDFADFIEEKRSTLGRLKAFRTIFDGPGKSAVDVSEKFAFVQLSWDGGAIDTDERLVAAFAAAVDLRATNSLPVPALASRTSSSR